MQERKIYLDYLRILATYSVVLLHVASKYIGGENQDILLVYDGLVRWAVPMFVMISGSIFLDTEYNISIEKIWKRCLRLLAIMIVWSLVYCFFEICRGNSRETVIQYALSGYWHMWFVFMIIGMYIISPVLKEISKNREVTWYYLFIILLFASIIPTVRDGIIPYTRFGDNTYILTLFKNVDTMNLQFVLGFTGYYLLGSYLDNTDYDDRRVMLCIAMGLLGFAINIGGNLWLTHRTGRIVQVFDDSMRINIVFECIGLYVCFKELVKRKIIGTFKVEKIRYASQLCFGTYLVHLLYRELLDIYFGFNVEVYISMPLWPLLCSLVIFGLSMGTSLVIMRIPGLRRFL